MLQFKVNWKARLLLGLGGFVLSLVLYLIVFESDLFFGLYMSFVLGFFQTIFFQPGLDSYDIKKQFSNYKFISTAYFRRYFLFFYAKLLIDENHLTLITNKWNSSNDVLQLDLEDIQSIQKIKYLGFLAQGLKLKTSTQNEIKIWVSDSDKVLEHLKEFSKSEKVIL